MRPPRVVLGLSLGLLAALLGCRQEDAAGSTSGTSLYLFDQSSHHVLVWKDMEAVFAATTPPSPDATLSADLIGSKIDTLAWGGMTLDPNRNQLFLVSQGGSVVRISNLRMQTGAITTTTDLASFTLDSSQRLSNGSFGQASVDPQTGTLFVTESNDTATRIWVVANAGSVPDTQTVSMVTLPAGSVNDHGGTGVAAAQGTVYAYMEGGDSVKTPTTTYDGQRLRRSTDASSFDAVLIGSNTQLGAYGTLAFDTGNATVYVGVSTSVATSKPHPVVAFKTGDFTSGFNQSPDFTLDSPVVDNLRVLAHAGSKDWLVGLKGVVGSGGASDTMFGDLVAWKSPGSSPSGAVITLSGSAQFRGAALDGSGG